MNKNRPRNLAQKRWCRRAASRLLIAAALALVIFDLPLKAQQQDLPAYTNERTDKAVGSTYVPLDSWMYPALMRLQALGFADTAFLGMRPWTRTTILNILAESAPQLADSPKDGEALGIYLALEKELRPPHEYDPGYRRPNLVFESQYVRALGIGGLPLRDSYYLGQSIANDYARPYQNGFNPIAGASARAEMGRFSLYFRGEYQHAPAAAGYSAALAQTLSAIDAIPFASNPVQATIPEGPIPAQNVFRIVEANASYRFANHEISFGKNDRWLGPAVGGSLAWSNNAENIYTFQIDRTEYLKIPGFSSIFGPVRYLFFVGSLKGHTYPNDPWIHLEKISFKPTENLEFGFDRAAIWGGQGHVPITVHSFLKSFFSFSNVSIAEKNSRDDPGARFAEFDFSYRLPYLRKWLTLYSDSLVHDDLSSLDAPRHAAIRPGLYLSHVPGVPKLDLRVEAADTDPPTGRSSGGQYIYTENVQRQGYTNKGFLLGDAIGREDKGGQAWLTYHLSPREQIQASYRNGKAPLDFISGGTTQNIWQISAVKRLHNDFEVRGQVQYERWKAPIYQPGLHTDVAASAQFTWYLPEKQ